MDSLLLLAASEAAAHISPVRELIAQAIVAIIGFVLLLLVLKKYAWGPVLQMIDERREHISAQFDEIDRKTAEANAILADYEERIRRLDEEARERINAAIEDGQKTAEDIVSHARKEAEGIVSKARQDMSLELETARLQLRQDVVEMTLAATGKLLHANMDDQKQRDLVNQFINDLQGQKAENA